jgi:hypothetical protein
MVKSIMSGSTHANPFGRSKATSPRQALETTAQVWLTLQNDDDIQIMKRGVGRTLDP